METKHLATRRRKDALKMGYKAVRNESQPYAKGTYVESDCLNIKFENMGAVDARVNGKPLAAGKVVEIETRYPYFDTTKYTLQFDTGLGTKLVWVTRTLLGYNDG